MLERIVIEPVESHHALPQIGEPDAERVDPGKLFSERNADVLGVGPLHDRTSASSSLTSGCPS